ncbi:hypothetical protein, partial [Massilia mucilaginosa]|uniref:hypothetical protein n=1 Tax=Massilia mucilaginosa TaxID=2609282 RepID=UPI001CB744D4
RTVKRFYADDSAATSVKVGHRQASYKKKTPQKCGVFFRPRFRQRRIAYPQTCRFISHLQFVIACFISKPCKSIGKQHYSSILLCKIVCDLNPE